LLDPAASRFEGQGEAFRRGILGGVDGDEGKAENFVAFRFRQAGGLDAEIDGQTQRGGWRERQPKQAEAADFKNASERGGGVGDAIYDLHLVIGDQKPALVHQAKQKIGFSAAGGAEEEGGV